MSDRMLLDRMLECLSDRVSIGGNRSTKVILRYLRYVLNISERIYEHGKRIIRIILYDCILQHFEIKSSIVPVLIYGCMIQTSLRSLMPKVQ